MKTPLPVIDSCNHCGACCLHLSTPPFLDYEWKYIPEDLRREIEAVEHAGVRQDGDGLGCMWFDHATRQCRHYDQRPDVCEGFEVGGEDCRRFRRDAGLPATER